LGVSSVPELSYTPTFFVSMVGTAAGAPRHNTARNGWAPMAGPPQPPWQLQQTLLSAAVAESLDIQLDW